MISKIISLSFSSAVEAQVPSETHYEDLVVNLSCTVSRERLSLLSLLTSRPVVRSSGACAPVEVWSRETQQKLIGQISRR